MKALWISKCDNKNIYEFTEEGMFQLLYSGPEVQKRYCLWRSKKKARLFTLTELVTRYLYFIVMFIMFERNVHKL